MGDPKRRRSAPAPYLILGPDSYLRGQQREEIIAALVPDEARSLAVVRYSLAETPLADVLRAATLPPLFSPQQVLLLSDVQDLAEEDLAPLEEFFGAPPSFTVLVFEAEALDRRTRVARLLLDRCELRSAEADDEHGALRAVEEFSHELGLQLSRETAEELVFAVGNEQGRLRAELEKLRAYVGDKREVTANDVAALVIAARRFTVFDLVDLLAERRRADTLARLRRLLEAGENPIGIVGLLAWLYRQLLLAQTLPAGTPDWKAARVLRAPTSRIGPLLRQARRFRPEELHRAFALLEEADVALKSSPPHPMAVLETLVVGLTAPGERPVRA